MVRRPTIEPRRGLGLFSSSSVPIQAMVVANNTSSYALEVPTLRSRRSFRSHAIVNLKVFPLRQNEHAPSIARKNSKTAVHTHGDHNGEHRDSSPYKSKKKGGTEGTETYLRREKNEEGEELEIRPSGHPDQAGKLLLPARAPSSARLLVPPARGKQPPPAPPAGWGGGRETPLGMGLRPSTDNEIASTYQPAVST
jgi:hypothetical protein